jgi:hypothetical protein
VASVDGGPAVYSSTHHALYSMLGVSVSLSIHSGRFTVVGTPWMREELK